MQHSDYDMQQSFAHDVCLIKVKHSNFLGNFGNFSKNLVLRLNLLQLPQKEQIVKVALPQFVSQIQMPKTVTVMPVLFQVKIAKNNRKVSFVRDVQGPIRNTLTKLFGTVSYRGRFL